MINLKDEIRKSTLNKNRAVETEILITDILPNPYQVRTIFNTEKLTDLETTIKTNGIVQPIVVQKREGKIYLVAGERRLRAAKNAGLMTVPVKFLKESADARLISILENIQREDLHPVDEAQGYASLKTAYQVSQEQLAELLGKGRSTVTEILGINKLSDKVKEKCRSSDNLSRNQLVKISKLKTEQKQLDMLEIILNGMKPKLPVKSKKPKSIMVAERTVRLANQIQKINFNEMPQEQKIEFKKALMEMLRAIQETL